MIKRDLYLSAVFSRPWARTPVPVYLISFAIPFLLIVTALSLGFEPSDLLRDPVSASGLEIEFFYLGFFSNLGMVAWTIAGAICLFVAVTDGARLAPHDRAFLAYAGALTLVLMLDDLYMLHENLGDQIFYAFYALGLLIYLYRFADVILRTDLIILALSILLLGMSALTDALVSLIVQEGFPADKKDVIRQQVAMVDSPYTMGNLRHLVEDAPKFIGICAWATFHVRAAYLLRR